MSLWQCRLPACLPERTTAVCLRHSVRQTPCGVRTPSIRRPCQCPACQYRDCQTTRLVQTKFSIRLCVHLRALAGVGKTCLMSRFAEDTFSDKHRPTIAVDFRERTLQIEENDIKLKIWDTSGQVWPVPFLFSKGRLFLSHSASFCKCCTHHR